MFNSSNLKYITLRGALFLSIVSICDNGLVESYWSEDNKYKNIKIYGQNKLEYVRKTDLETLLTSETLAYEGIWNSGTIQSKANIWSNETNFYFEMELQTVKKKNEKPAELQKLETENGKVAIGFSLSRLPTNQGLPGEQYNSLDGCICKASRTGIEP